MIDKSLQFEMETNASDITTVATLSQSGCRVAFFSRIFQGPEKYYTSKEKEVQAIIKGVHHQWHYLTMKTDQRSIR